MSVETDAEMQGLAAAGEAVAVTLRLMREYAKEGMSTKALDDYGFGILQSFGANPAPKKDYGFPGYTCISINNEVCHGIPSTTTILQEGDLVNIDVSAELNGFYGDNGGSFILGKDHQRLQPLVDASQEFALGHCQNQEPSQNCRLGWIYRKGRQKTRISRSQEYLWAWDRSKVA